MWDYKVYFYDDFYDIPRTFIPSFYLVSIDNNIWERNSKMYKKLYV